jgi:ParB/RepB/Spo0J family partition protein
MATRAPQAHVLTVLNLKGGVGKTHTSRVLASVAQEREQRILLIDLDTQGNLSKSFLEAVALSVRFLPDEDVYQIISGERRYQASKLAGLNTIPCLIHEPQQRDVLVRQVVENWQRAQLHPFEIADALSQLRDQNDYSQKRLAEEIGKPEPEISRFLKLLELQPSVQKDARNDPSGVLSFRHLYNIARLTPDGQSAMVAAVREQRLSAVETEKLVHREIARSMASPKRGAPVTRVQYVTTKARVIPTFRKQSVTNEEIVAALDEARDKARPTKEKLNIERRN